jgi:uncharacterized Fe-S cluster-containing radical SAM superfamily enzyme
MLAIGGAALAHLVAVQARDAAQHLVGDEVRVDVLVVDRNGAIVGASG